MKAYSGTMYDTPVGMSQADHTYVLLIHWKDHGPDYIQRIAGPRDCLEAAKSINDGLAGDAPDANKRDADVLCFPGFPND